MAPLTRITFDPDVMGGKPCIRGLRVTVGTVVGLVAAGRTLPEILAAHAYLESGAPARAIQELAGHQDLTTTQRYMHLSPAAIEGAIRLLEQSGPASAFAPALRRTRKPDTMLRW